MKEGQCCQLPKWLTKRLMDKAETHGRGVKGQCRRQPPMVLKALERGALLGGKGGKALKEKG